MRHYFLIVIIFVMSACAPSAVPVESTPTPQSAPKITPQQKIAPTQAPERTATTAPPAPTRAIASTPTRAATLALYDAHLHQVVSLAQPALIANLKQYGVEGALLLGAHDTDAADAPFDKANASFLMNFVGLPTDARTKKGLFTDQTAALIEQELNKSGARGIGEISLRLTTNPNLGNAYPADGPVALAIYDLAAKHKVPVTVHVNSTFSAELERGADHNKSAIIIWAHVGDGQPAQVGDVLRKHANLYADLSGRNPYMQRGYAIADQQLTNADGSLKSDWKSLLEEFADRILFGTDISSDRYPDLNLLFTYYRSVLAQITPDAAEKIANKNVKRILGVK
ncbi:MAG: amidohydrolase family protein [Chloroflexi bacterium]|nr:amidohydrolase family protein [Chloroflexota bacterium]MBI3741835.1 amidohydrolase family protein [Chloroflexota bacterium]